MINTYLTWKFHLPMIIAGTLCYLLLSFYIVGIFATIYLFISWLFRKEYLANKEMVGLLSPFTGKIKKIYKSKHILIPESLQCIELGYGLLSGYGIFFPDDFEVYDIVKNDEEVFINLKSEDDNPVVINFKKNLFGLLPKLWVFPGDRGKKGARIGFSPLGGKATVYIPEKYKLHHGENSILIGGVTSFASR